MIIICLQYRQLIRLPNLIMCASSLKQVNRPSDRSKIFSNTEPSPFRSLKFFRKPFVFLKKYDQVDCDIVLIISVFKGVQTDDVGTQEFVRKH
jgi:hypothetical protein